MVIKFIALLASVLSCFLANFTECLCQNLVKNPKFEEYYHLPDLKYEYDIRYQDSAFICKNWQCIKGTTPDYYHINAKHFYYKIPCSRIGCNPVLNDSAYIGFIPFSFSGGCEIFFGELLTPLKSGKKYEIKFLYRFANVISYYSLSKLEIYLSKDIEHFKSIKNPFPLYKDIITPNIKASAVFDSLKNDGEWHEATTYFIAKGGEQYISFGIFHQNNKLYKILYEYFKNNLALEQNSYKYIRLYKKHRKTLAFINKNPEYSPNKIKDMLRITFESNVDTKTYLYKEKHPYYLIDNISLKEI